MAESNSNSLEPELIPRYHAKYAVRVREAARIGCTRAEIATLLKIHPDVVTLWTLIHSDFAHAMAANTEARKVRMEDALYQRGIGYDFDSEKIVKTSDDRILRVKTRQHLPADVTAALNWLKVNYPERYGQAGMDGIEGGVIRFTIENDPEKV